MRERQWTAAGVGGTERKRNSAVGVREAGSAEKSLGGRGWTKKIFERTSKCRKLSHSAENTLFHIFIH